MVEEALAGVEADGDDLQRAEARLLWTRHVLWTGQLEAAAHSIELSADDWSVLGLPEPVSLVRQRRALHLLGGRPGGRSEGAPAGPGTAMLGDGAIAADRAGPAQRALWLARSDRPDRAAEHLDAIADEAKIRIHLNVEEIVGLQVVVQALVEHIDGGCIDRHVE